MTRGTFCFIGPDGIYVSAEFNGDMYPDGYGDAAFAGLAACRDSDEFAAFVKDFNDENFQYKDEQLVYGPEDRYVTAKKAMWDAECLDFAHNYCENWFSDWVFVVNRSGVPMPFQARGAYGPDGDEVLLSDCSLPSDHAMRLEFGHIGQENDGDGIEWYRTCPAQEEAR
jgi:hypothetical protein